MSNHAGSYMLNEVLRALERRGVFELLGRPAAQELVIEIVRLSDHYDCNVGEILEEMGEKLGICSWCLTPRTDLADCICGACRARWP